MSAPGDILAEEFLKPLGVTIYRLSKATEMPASRLHEIVAGRRGISADTACRLARTFGTTPEFWMNLQNGHDLAETKRKNGKLYNRIKRL